MRNWGKLVKSNRVRIFLAVLFVGIILTPVGNLKAEGINYALRFDGIDDYADLGMMNSIYGSDSWRSTKSFVVYFKPDQAGTSCLHNDQAWCKLVAGTKDTRWWGITQGIIQGQDRIWVWNMDDNGLDTISVEYTPGEWLQIAVVHAGGLLKVYKNGSLIDSVASGLTHIAEGQNPKLILGSFIYQPPEGTPGFLAYQGLIDEVRIYSTALSRESILPHIHTEIPDPQNEVGLLAYYQMSDGPPSPNPMDTEGQLLTEDTGRGHSGVLRNGVQWFGSPIFDDEPVPVTYYLYLPMAIK